MSTAGSRWRQTIRVGWLVIVAAVLGGVLADRWQEVRPALGAMTVGATVAAICAGLVAVALTGAVWRSVLAGLGSPLPWTDAARIFFVGQLGKYLPGSVWPLLAQVELGRDVAVAGRTSAAALVLFMWIHLVTGAAVAALTLPFAGFPAVLALAAVPCAILLLPGPLRWALGRALRMLGRAPLPQQLDGATMARATGWAVLVWTAYAAHLALLVSALDGAIPLVGAAAAFSAAWVAGFIFVIAPAGAGVREAVLAGVLLRVMDTGPALAAVLASRMVTTGADALLAAVGLVSGRRRLSRGSGPS